MITCGWCEVLLSNTFVSESPDTQTINIGVTYYRVPGAAYGSIISPISGYAQGFTTGNNFFNNISYSPIIGYNFPSDYGQANMVLSLYSDLNNKPNVFLSQFSGPAVPSVDSNNIYYLDPNLTLAPETKYWIGGINTEVVGSNTFIRPVAIYVTTDPSLNTSNGFIIGDAQVYHRNGTWRGSIGSPTIFSLSGSVVPEPSALSLLAFGLGGLAMMRRHRL